MKTPKTPKGPPTAFRFPSDVEKLLGRALKITGWTKTKIVVEALRSELKNYAGKRIVIGE